MLGVACAQAGWCPPPRPARSLLARGERVRDLDIGHAGRAAAFCRRCRRSPRRFPSKHDTFGKPGCSRRGCTSRRWPGPCACPCCWPSRRPSSKDLETAMLSRSVIDQALGVIMGHHAPRETRSFDLPRAASQSRNLKLREVAALVRNLSGHPPAGPRPRNGGPASTGRPRPRARWPVEQRPPEARMRRRRCLSGDAGGRQRPPLPARGAGLCGLDCMGPSCLP